MGASAIAVIPARGGSRRLPRKNVAEFLGRPIIAWTIEAALASACFDRVVVSTEDEEVAAVAARYGAVVSQRPAALARDGARVVSVCLHVLEDESAGGRHHDVLACLYPTAPLRNAADIRAVVGLLSPGRCECAMAVTRPAFPPHQALRLEHGSLTPQWPDLVSLRADEVGDLVIDNGSTYAVSVAAFRDDQTFYGPGLRGHVMPRARSVDIDEADDLELARYYGRAMASACAS